MALGLLLVSSGLARTLVLKEFALFRFSGLAAFDRKLLDIKHKQPRFEKTQRAIHTRQIRQRKGLE